jgi:hypothetical protein
MSKAKFEKWLTDGPDSMPQKDVMEALDWRDANPHEAFTAEQEYRAHRDLEERRELLTGAARRQGLSSAEATSLAQRILDEEREKNIRDSDDRARIAAARSVLSGF